MFFVVVFLHIIIQMYILNDVSMHFCFTAMDVSLFNLYFGFFIACNNSPYLIIIF